MGTMPSPVEKDSILQKLDYYTKLTDPKKIDELKDDLAAAKPKKAQKLLRDAIGLTKAERIHLRAWLENPSGWKVEGGVTLAALLKKKIAEALEEVVALELPLDCFWVCYPGQSDTVTVRWGRRPNQSVIGFDILTPPPKEDP